MRLIMRRDRSSRCVMSARTADAVDHHSSQLKLRKLRCNSSDLPRLSKEVAVRSNARRVALSRNSNDRNRSNARHRLSVRRDR